MRARTSSSRLAVATAGRGLAVALLAALGVAAQVPAAGRAGIDPFTRHDAGAIARAGYLSLGPFDFGREHGSAEIDALLPGEAVAWIETAHFRIGCSLAAIDVRGDRDWRQRVREDLAALKQRLPAVRPETQKLEPWLRAHRIALHCEAIYADVCAHLDVDDTRFPQVPGHDARKPVTFMGCGPYLGVEEKFGVLVMHDLANLARYTRAYMGGESQDAVRHYEVGSALTLALCEQSPGIVGDDFSLHTQLAYHVSLQLYTAYRGYGHDLPAWLGAGLAHWHARRCCPRFPTHERRAGEPREQSPFWQWDDRAKGLMRTGAFESLAELMARRDIASFRLEQHIESWALVDWLMRERRDATRVFLHEFKAPFHALQSVPTAAELQVRNDECLRKAFHTDADGLMAMWRAAMPVAKK